MASLPDPYGTFVRFLWCRPYGIRCPQILELFFCFFWSKRKLFSDLPPTIDFYIFVFFTKFVVKTRIFLHFFQKNACTHSRSCLRRHFFKRHVEQLARGAVDSGMHSIATVATKFELQVSIYRSRRETPIATIAEIEHERFQRLQSLLSLPSLLSRTLRFPNNFGRDGSDYMETGLCWVV